MLRCISLFCQHSGTFTAMFPANVQSGVALCCTCFGIQRCFPVVQPFWSRKALKSVVFMQQQLQYLYLNADKLRQEAQFTPRASSGQALIWGLGHLMKETLSAMIEVLTIWFFWEGVMLWGVEKSEQMSLESFAEDGEWFCCPDIGREFIPPLTQGHGGGAWTWSCVASFVGKDQILQMLLRANLQDGAKAVTLVAQDCPSSRITPWFFTVNERNTMTSSTGTDRSMRGQSLPGIKRSSVLLRLSLRWGCRPSRLQNDSSKTPVVLQVQYQWRKSRDRRRSVVDSEVVWLPQRLYVFVQQPDAAGDAAGDAVAMQARLHLQSSPLITADLGNLKQLGWVFTGSSSNWRRTSDARVQIHFSRLFLITDL